MTNAALDRTLAILLVAIAASGLLTLRAGSAENSWLFVLHGCLGGALAAVVTLKLRRCVP